MYLLKYAMIHCFIQYSSVYYVHSGIPHTPFLARKIDTQSSFHCKMHTGQQGKSPAEDHIKMKGFW